MLKDFFLPGFILPTSVRYQNGYTLVSFKQGSSTYKSPKMPYSHCFSPHRKKKTCHTISKMNPDSHVSLFVFFFFVSIRHSREMKRTWQAFLIRAILNRTGKNFCFSKIHCFQRGKRLMEICCLFWKHKWPQMSSSFETWLI